MINKSSTQSDFDSIRKQAAGRRRYNAERQAKARKRFVIVLDMLSGPEGQKRGAQAAIARSLGIHRSAVCRDWAKYKRLLLKVSQLNLRLWDQETTS